MSEKSNLPKHTSGIKILSKDIEKKIEESIRNRRYGTRERLPTEAEFCKQFNVSRTAVREALKGLQSRGLVQIRKGSGVYVAEMSSQDATNPLDLYFEMSDDEDLVSNTLKARQLFEPEIAATAALQRSDLHIINMENNLAKLQTCDLNDVEAETNIDIEFHALIIEASCNSVINIIMKPIHNLALRHSKLVYGKSEKLDMADLRQSVVHFHGRILEAIKNRNSRDAYYQMKEHLYNTELNLKKINL